MSSLNYAKRLGATVLVAEDDEDIRDLVALRLGSAGYRTLTVDNGNAAVSVAHLERPDLVLLDINMPRMDGLEVCRRIRAQSELPILFLSSRDDEIDRVLGIELGADDYVVKPFSPREVAARVTAILRRSAPKTRHPEAGEQLSVGELTLDTEGWRARWKGAEAPLTVTEFSILRALASAPSKVFTRDAIIDRLHGPGFAVTDRTIDSHVRNIRAKFSALGGHDIVETRAGVGYQLGACSGRIG